MSQDDLAQYLDSLEREDRYRVVEVLKESPLEITEKVLLVRDDGTEEGPFIRKRIRRDVGLGGAYARIYEAQRNGVKLDYLPRIIECYQRDDELVAVTEFVEGMTLLDLVYEQDPSIMLAARIFPLLCDAVSELHEKFNPPIIHRDLKPSNVIVGTDRLTIIDFGIARDYDSTASTDTTQFGTRAYAPPEQYGYGQTDKRSDVYALGMMLYFLLTETTPTPKTVQKRFKDADIPEAVRQVVEKATAFDPSARYESARELKRAFAQALLTAGTSKRAVGSQDDEEASIDERTREPEGGWDQGLEQGAGTTNEVAETAARIAAMATLPQEQPAAPPPPIQAPPKRKQPPTFKKRKPSKPKTNSERFEKLGKAWNGLVLITLAILTLATISLAFNVPANMQHYPRWFNTFGYLVIVPGLFALAAYALMDKRRIRAKIPFLSGLERWQEVLLWIGLVAGLLVVFTIASVLAS